MVRVTLHEHGTAPETVECVDVEAASRAVVDFQDERGMGASDMGRKHGQVFVDGKLTYQIAYNGRVNAAKK